MKTGKTLVELATEIQRQAESKHDYIAPAQRLSMTVDENKTLLTMQNGTVKTYGIMQTAHEQIGQRLDIPRAYYERLLAGSWSDREMLAKNANHWLEKSDARFLVRTIDGSARALLSDRYRPLDNYDLAESVLPKLISSGCQVESCELTDKRLYIKAVTPRITAEVKKNDVVQMGMVITNSEIGLGAIKIEPMIYRLICLNGAIVNDMAMRKQHVGKRREFVELDNAEQYYTDRTRIADDNAFWLKVIDVVSAMIDETMFQKIVTRWKDATEQKITVGPVEIVERTAKRLVLSEGEKTSVLTHLIQGGDLTAYGLMNAVTRSAQDVESYDRSTDLERMGAGILELPRSQWHEFAEVA